MNNKINELVIYYQKNKEIIKKNWNETETRIELINPFFECLGWDVNNTQKLADPFKEVKHEASLKIGTNVKAPDYSFNYGKKIFYLEAKKPSVDIKHDIHPAYQLRRYGWTAKLPISILTDFEELSIYDCRIKPDKNDNAGIARLKFYTINDYINKWDEIYNFISKDAILHGSLNEFENKEIKGTASIDDDFLNYIEDIRKLLALDIAKRNTDLSENDFNFAIQMIIDRIIFIRICEDRGIENYESLKEAASNSNCYDKLINLFQKADSKYNSGLFHFKKEPGREETPDSITEKLKIDDRVLKEIINGLYYPDCPFALDVIESDVLGSVYERFLGKVITLSESHKAKIDYKPEVRKAGGVYYTPHYIVEYIVNNTVGELIKNKTPDQISKIKILDPACGSGSFLVEAYQYLLDHHLNYYHNNESDKWKKGKEPKIFESQTGLHLTLSERKRILLNNIFGVDIDKQAVEVTKLSLLLKVLEYEGLEVKQKSLFDERVLPDLYKNIKCGNSLIGSDFYKDKNISLFDEDEIKRVNAFDWEREFEEVFKSGGFDVVIGNPPWGAEFSENEKKYLIKHNTIVPSKTKDSYFYFLFKIIKIIKLDGILGFIIPNTWLLINNAKSVREELLKHEIIEIIDYGDGVFKDAIVESSSIILKKQKSDNKICKVKRYKKDVLITDSIIDINFWLKDPLCRFVLETDENFNKIYDKCLKASQIFNKNCEIIFGIKPYQLGYGKPPQTKNIIEKRIYHSNIKINDLWKPLLVGSDIDRYKLIDPGNQFIKYGEWLMYKSNEDKMNSPKIFLRRTSDNIKACYDDKAYFGQNSLFIITSLVINLKYILGIFNSKLFKYLYKMKCPQIGKIFAEIKPSIIKELPIRKIDFSNPSEKSSHDKLVSLVDQMLDLQKKYHSVKTDHEKKIYKNQIDSIDNQIDTLVYALYGLTDDEIKIVEGK